MLLTLLRLPVVGAVDRLVWNGATRLAQCEEATMSWSGGTPPYSLQVRVVDPTDLLSALNNEETDRWLARNLSEPTYTWRVDYAAGNGILFGVEDSGNPKRITGSYAGALSIGGGSEGCELVAVPTSASASASATSSPGTLYQIVTTPKDTATGISSATPSARPTGSGGSTNVGAIVGGVVGGVLGLALIIGVIIGIWLCTRRRQRVKEEKEEFVVDDTANAMEPMEAMETTLHPITPYKNDSGWSDARTPTQATPLLPKAPQSPGAPGAPGSYALSPLSPGQQAPVPFAMPGPVPQAPQAPPSAYESEYAVDAGPVREQHPPRYDPRWSRERRKP